MAESVETSQAGGSLSRDEVARLAGLARIDLTAAELDHLAPQLAVILDAVTAVGAVAADDVPLTSHPLPLRNVSRPDVVRQSLAPEEALGGAPQVEQQRFSVPRILEEEG